MKLNKIMYSTIFLFIFFVILINLNYIYYKVFPQVYIMITEKREIFSLIKSKHPHLPRYIVELPSIIIAEKFNVNIHIINTYYSIILLTSSFNLILKIFKKLEILNNLIILLSVLIVVLLSLMVNGRFIFAFFGESLFIYEMLLNKKKYIFLALLYCMVSSGTMMVIIVSMILIGLKKRIYLKKNMMILFLLFIFTIGKYVFLMIKRNYLYFDKNLIKVFSHGILEQIYFINQKLMISLAIFIFLIALLIMIILLKKYKKLEKLLMITMSSLICGFFGKTTFAMIILPIFIILTYIFYKRLKGS